MTITSIGRRYNNLVSNSCLLISSLKQSKIISPIKGCIATKANSLSEISLIQIIYSGNFENKSQLISSLLLVPINSSPKYVALV